MKKITLTLERSKYQDDNDHYSYKVVKATNTTEWIVWSDLTKEEVDEINANRDEVTVHIVPPKG